jgi:opacity protein-like surface antigen
MIKRAFVVGVFLSLPIFGQDYPVNQFFIGASAQAIVDGPTSLLAGPNFAHSLTTHDRGKKGLDASFTHNFNSRIGFESDFSAFFSDSPQTGKFNSIAQDISSDIKAYNFNFGPQFRFQNRSRVTPFAHTLAGVGHVHADFNTAGAGLTQQRQDSRTGASLIFGGGIDTRVASHATIRLGVDYNPTFLGAPYTGASSVQNNVRMNLGVVIHSRYDH